MSLNSDELKSSKLSKKSLFMFPILKNVSDDRSDISLAVSLLKSDISLDNSVEV